MGRKAKDRRLETLKEKLLEKIASEEEPTKLREWLGCYKSVISILEHQEDEKAKKKLAMPR